MASISQSNVSRRVSSKWNKTLYEDYGVPDNYVDETFLNGLRMFSRKYRLWPTVLHSTVILQQISGVALFLSLYCLLRDSRLTFTPLLGSASCITLLAYCAYRLLAEDSTPQRPVSHEARSAAVLLCCAALLSPVLMTLTEAISTDTLYCMSALLFGLGLLTHDYSHRQPGSVSLNASLFGAVCLGSRLPGARLSFLLLILAVLLFALLPLLCARLKARFGLGVSALLSVLAVCASAAVLSTAHSSYASAAFLLLSIVISLLCPAWLVSLQRYKKSVQGPWDEACIRE